MAHEANDSDDSLHDLIQDLIASEEAEEKKQQSYPNKRLTETFANTIIPKVSNNPNPIQPVTSTAPTPITELLSKFGYSLPSHQAFDLFQANNITTVEQLLEYAHSHLLNHHGQGTYSHSHEKEKKQDTRTDGHARIATPVSQAFFANARTSNNVKKLYEIDEQLG